MTIKIPVKGTVVSNDDAEVYDWLGYENVSPKAVMDALDGAEGDNVEVNINSGGGSVFAASEIYTLLQGHNGKVTVNIQGLAASAASVIAMAGDEVNMSPTAQMMIHKAATWSVGNSDDFAHDSKMLDVTDQSIVNAYEAKTGMNRDDLLNMMKDETWMDAKTALDKGFADSIITRKQPQVVNAIAGPGLNTDAIDKIKVLLAETRSQPASDTDNAANSASEGQNLHLQPAHGDEVTDLKQQKLVILKGE